VVGEVEQISASTEESAAATQQITALVNQQQEAVESVAKAIVNIEQSAAQLKDWPNSLVEPGRLDTFTQLSDLLLAGIFLPVAV